MARPELEDCCQCEGLGMMVTVNMPCIDCRGHGTQCSLCMKPRLVVPEDLPAGDDPLDWCHCRSDTPVERPRCDRCHKLLILCICDVEL
jgi:hypothetical protein